MQIERKHQIEASPRLTPLIDVVLLLLIFFLLTSNFIDQTAVSVTLPESETGEEAVQKEVITIAITADNNISYAGSRVTPEELEKKVREEKKKKFTIYADKEASFGIIMDVWDIFRTNKIRNFHIQVRHEQSK